MTVYMFTFCIFIFGWAPLALFFARRLYVVEQQLADLRLDALADRRQNKNELLTLHHAVAAVMSKQHEATHGNTTCKLCGSDVKVLVQDRPPDP